MELAGVPPLLKVRGQRRDFQALPASWAALQTEAHEPRTATRHTNYALTASSSDQPQLGVPSQSLRAGLSTRSHRGLGQVVSAVMGRRPADSELAAARSRSASASKRPFE